MCADHHFSHSITCLRSLCGLQFFSSRLCCVDQRALGRFGAWRSGLDAGAMALKICWPGNVSASKFPFVDKFSYPRNEMSRFKGASMEVVGGADVSLKNAPRFALNWKSFPKAPSVGRYGPSSVAAAASIRSMGVMEQEEELTLDSIRDSLIRQEDTIIYNLLERAQYCTNPPTYIPEYFPIEGFTGSLIQYLLKETERLHASVCRFTSPDEHAFFPRELPKPLLPTMTYPKVLHEAADSININSDVWDMYFDQLLPGIAAKGDDGNYGSAATCDVLCLQALSKRIHYGKFVAEAKFTDTPHVFEPHIRAQDSEALYKLITFESVELAVQHRVEAKARTYGQEVDLDANKPPVYKIDPKVVAWLYGEWVMPLTKKVQVQYLLRRLD